MRQVRHPEEAQKCPEQTLICRALNRLRVEDETVQVPSECHEIDLGIREFSPESWQ